jgi:hypothetical protein
MKILTAIQVKLVEGEQGAVYGKWRGKESVDCYLKVLERFKYLDGMNIEFIRETRRVGEEALAMCPEAPGAYYLMGWVHIMELAMGIGKSPSGVC